MVLLSVLNTQVQKKKQFLNVKNVAMNGKQEQTIKNNILNALNAKNEIEDLV